MKKYIVSTLLLIGFWISIWVLFSWSVLDMTNRTFMVGLISLTIFVILKILQSGFLNLFLGGMRQLKNVIIRKSNAQTRTEDQLKDDVQLEEFKRNTYDWFLKITLMTAMASLVMSLFGLVLFYESIS